MANSLEQVLSRVRQILTPVASNAMTAARAATNPVGFTMNQIAGTRQAQNIAREVIRPATDLVGGSVGAITHGVNYLRTGNPAEFQAQMQSGSRAFGSTLENGKFKFTGTGAPALATEIYGGMSPYAKGFATFSGGLGAIGAAVNKSDISTGIGQGITSGLQTAGMIQATNPIIGKALGKLPIKAPQIVQNRLAPIIGNVAQGLAISKSQGMPITPLGIGFDVVTGAIGGKGQFSQLSKVDDLLKQGKALGFNEVSPRVSSIHAEDLDVMREFADYMRNNSGKKNMGELGKSAQRIADHYFGGAWKNANNKKLAEAFEWAIDLNMNIPRDARGVLPKANLVSSTNPTEALKVEASIRDNVNKIQQDFLAGKISMDQRKALAEKEFSRSLTNPSVTKGVDPTEALKVERNKIPVKRDLTQQVAENITGKSMKVKPDTTKVEAPPIAPLVEPEIVKSNNRAAKAGVPTREVVGASLPQKLDNFIQETLGYTTQKPVGGSREAGAYTKLLRSGQEKITSAVERGLGSENPLVRNATSTMQGFFRGLGMSPERAAQSAELRGGLSTATQRAYDVEKTLYELLGKNKESLARINAVLDPDIAKMSVKFSDLTPDEQATLNLIRKGFDYIHDSNYANGFITEKTYRSNLGTYTPRRYTVFETPPEINQFTKQTKKIDTTSYKKRKELDAWKVENSLNDPVYALGRAMAQSESNAVIKKYTDFLSTQPQLITDIPRPGFTKLSDSPAYGALAGKYVLNSAAEDLKGFFYANEALQHVYDAFKTYDRLPLRQLQKKFLTVFNPTTNVGNIVSDIVFGFHAGVDPLTLHKNLYQIKKQPEIYKQLSDYLMSRGVVGTDITRTDFVDTLSSIDDLAKGIEVKQGKIKTVANKAQSFYGGTDDAYKVASFKSLLDKGFTLEEATRKVADGFQNYSNVGKFYDTWSKTPLVGSPFIKFQGDLMRIIKNTAVNNPLALITFLGTLQAVSYLSSKASGETPEDYKTRTERFAAPMIPGLNIPLTWQTPIGEINVARYISPFYANNDTTNLSKMIPFAPSIDTNKDLASNVAMNVNDPLLAPIAQAIVNRDFRGKPISDPGETKYNESTMTGGEKNVNRIKFLGRAYLPPQANSIIDVGSAVQGKPNMYGSMQTPGQALARVGGVKISQFGPKEAANQRINDAYYSQKGLEAQDRQIKAVAKELLSGKIDQKTADARIANIQKSASDTQLSGENITQLPSGTYATLINGKMVEKDTLEEVQKEIAKDSFKKSGKNIDIVGDTVWRLSKDGDATSEPKIDYDTKMTTQKMENAKLDNDYKTWQDLAFTQLQNYQTQMLDPTLDELEKGDLQQKIDALIRSAIKYQGYGGFKKAKKITPPKMQVAKFAKPTFKMKRDNAKKKSSIKVVSSKSIAPPKISVGRFKKA